MADLLSQAQQAGQQALSSLQAAAAPLGSPAAPWPQNLQLPQIPQTLQTPQLGDLRLPRLPSQWQLPSLPSQWQLPSAPSLPAQWSLPAGPSTPSVPSIPALDARLEQVFGSSPQPHFGTQTALDALQAAISWTSYEVPPQRV